MARKKKHEEHENHERWLVSYADFITLLFAFFVVMYSISSVNEGKFKVLSNAMVAAFHTPAKSLAPIQVGKMVRSPQEPLQEVMNTPVPLVPTPISLSLPMPTVANMEPMRVGGTASENGERKPRETDRSAAVGVAVQVPPGDAARKQVEAIADQVETALKALIHAGKVRVRRSKL
ncbi:MAG: flagellar motor protein MotB [Porticoccaceae bacterium]